jgi:murein tripeptide amidase MpaA
LTNYGRDQEAETNPDLAMVNRLLDTRTFYIMPRHTPDGAERVLTTPHRLRSSTRPYPYEEDKDGLYPEDLDGDGLIRQMRIADPNGEWKVSPQDPRLLVKRDLADEGGQYYRVYPEGLVRNYDGYMLKVPPVKEGLDLNRNYGFDWAPDNEQAGAGPFPLSEPETQAISHFWIKHRNICGSQSYHTFAGVILRPYSGKPDDAFPTHDLEVYKKIGERGTEMTSYPMASIFHGFRYDPKTYLRGAFLDWAYEHQGVFALSTELWDTISLAGIEQRDFIEFMSKKRKPEDELKVYNWMWENLPGAFKNWEHFDHPQLGPVEIGGWNFVYSWQNPPPGSQWLKDICDKNARFSFVCAAISPLLTMPVLKVEPVEPTEQQGRANSAIYRVTAVVENSGYLPTYVSKKAQERRFLKPLTVEVVVDEGIEVLSGDAKQEFGHLEGRSNKQSISPFQPGMSSDYRVKAEWIIRANPGAVVTVEGYCERGGRVRKEVAV